MIRDLIRYRPLYLFDHETQFDVRVVRILDKMAGSLESFNEFEEVWTGLLLTYDEQVCS